MLELQKLATLYCDRKMIIVFLKRKYFLKSALGNMTQN